eukprot:1190895-Prorocentrum_minimum.AAC.3
MVMVSHNQMGAEAAGRPSCQPLIEKTARRTDLVCRLGSVEWQSGKKTALYIKLKYKSSCNYPRGLAVKVRPRAILRQHAYDYPFARYMLRSTRVEHPRCGVHLSSARFRGPTRRPLHCSPAYCGLLTSLLISRLTRQRYGFSRRLRVLKRVASASPKGN